MSASLVRRAVCKCIRSVASEDPAAEQRRCLQYKQVRITVIAIDTVSLPCMAYIGPGAGFAFLGSFVVLLVAFLLVVLVILTLPFRILFNMVFRRRKKRGKGVRRVVVMGLDGLDPKRTTRLMTAGKLPNFSKLAESGSFMNLDTTLPSISPVAWSSFMTGVHPGKHGIFDFLNRDLNSCMPVLSSSRISSVTRRFMGIRLPGSKPHVRMLRRSRPFWSILGEYGVFSSVLRVPITFPPEKFNGTCLSAMCTPDLRGSQGSFTLFTTETDESAVTGGMRVPVEFQAGKIATRIPGPEVARGNGTTTLHADMTLVPDTENKTVRIRVSGREFVLKEGEYSGWTTVVFGKRPFARIRGIVRFRLCSVAPVFNLYMTPINIDPANPAMPVSHPTVFAPYLAKLQGAYATLGLAEDTWALNSGAIDDAAFLKQAYDIHAEREKMFVEMLRVVRKGFVACVFDASDRIQHMFHRYDDENHPALRADSDASMKTAMDDMYVRMDEMLGRVMRSIDDKTVFFVMSDHGFCDFSRGVNLNAWLKSEGYLVLKQDNEDTEYLQSVDWSRTRAYTFGLSGLYLNLKGRESRGIVNQGQEESDLKAEIIGKLLKLADGDRENPIINVYDSAESFNGPYSGNGPDLVVGYRKGYRASWDAAVGRTAGPVFSDNTKKWSGDHCVDPGQVPGVLFCNRKIGEDAVSITDLAPTILNLFGVPAPGYMDGRSLKVQISPDKRARQWS